MKYSTFSQRKRVKEKVRKLLEVVSQHSSLLILTHINPDPDSLASAAGLQHLLQEKTGVNSEIAFGGIVGRAENKSMIKHCNLKVFSAEVIEYDKYDCIALVDCQPGTGNVSIKEGCDKMVCIIIDHHPAMVDENEYAFCDMSENYGATSTKIAEYLCCSHIEPDTKLATALLYGIKSDTRDLGRQSFPIDKQMYTYLFPKSDISILSQIEHEKVSKDYFQVFGEAIKRARIYSTNIIVSCLGEIDNPDIVAELAEYFFRLENISWVLCIGIYKNQFIMSVRSEDTKEHAGALLAEVIEGYGTAGGHKTMAGGQVQLHELSPQEVIALQEDIIKKFITKLDKNPDAHELLFSEVKMKQDGF